MLLNNQQIVDKICIETNKNEGITTQNLWGLVKSVAKGKFITINACLKKQEKNQINDLKHLDEEVKSPVVSRMK